MVQDLEGRAVARQARCARAAGKFSAASRDERVGGRGCALTAVLMLAGALGVANAATPAEAASVTFSTAELEGDGTRGAAFEGTFSYYSAPVDRGAGFGVGGTLTVSLTNTTSPSAGIGRLTAFGFNLPDAFELTATPTPIQFLEGPTTTGGDDRFAELQTYPAKAADGYGYFDYGIGARDLKNDTDREDLNGGGKPQAGLVSGETAEFVFHVAHETFPDLFAIDFLTNVSTGKPAVFYARFQDGTSDGAPGTIVETTTEDFTIVPLPASVWSGMALLGVLGVFMLIRRRAAAQPRVV